MQYIGLLISTRVKDVMDPYCNFKAKIMEKIKKWKFVLSLPFFKNTIKDRICILFFCHSHSHSALCNLYPVALDRNRR